VRCLYLGPLGELSSLDDARLEATTERHKLDITPQPLHETGSVPEILARDPKWQGVILEMHTGWPDRLRLSIARKALALGRRVWIHFPDEHAVEVIDAERLQSQRRHWRFITAGFASRRVAGVAGRTLGRVAARLPRPLNRVIPQRFHHVDTSASDRRVAELNRLIGDAQPVPFAVHHATVDHPIRGCGAYLRTDFWAKIESGGSYGHTCYVAKELAAVTEQFACLMPHRYRLLDEYGLRQLVIEPPDVHASESVIVNATPHYYAALKAAFDLLTPAYIYERLCLGNYAGAMLSKTMGIPYIVEYNGSEISMRRSFDGAGYVYEREYLLAEALAFAQATMISVVSAEVKAGLVARGVSADKIMVNPNGADLQAYAQPLPQEKSTIRAELGLAQGAPVVGFTGTFGGWHGIEVLAAAIPRICERVADAQFLLIGDGAYKHLVDKEVETHALQSRVISTGRVPQVQGARFLKSCDLFVSPHSSHMVDSKFFGSPTKLFEYMAMGGGIVASDLEQIGMVLSPALRPEELGAPALEVHDQRAVLCKPGDVDEFVTSVVGLLDRPNVARDLGRNARRAVEQHYSWTRHVARLWPFLAGERADVADLVRKRAAVAATVAADAGPTIATGDAYKDQVQKQWDNDPAGSHYVKNAEQHTLEWFKEVEDYRYGIYAPWMFETMEFGQHGGKQLLEIGAGIGTDHAQFASHGAITTDLDLSAGHLALAKENFERRGLTGRFIHHDAETLPFDDNTFDVVYSNGVIHHTPNTKQVVSEIHRVLKPGGGAIIMVYAENSLHYWRNLVWAIGIKDGALWRQSMGEIMSRSVERSDNAAARPLVKVYTPTRLRNLFAAFKDIQIVQRQMVAEEKPRLLARVPLPLMGRMMGWNLIIKARKPAR
jgi:glycosyltransferase involved in cell wall biosynthesis/ubiquinone/menaquinone biosynthesis C-methylase UbiE